MLWQLLISWQQKNKKEVTRAHAKYVSVSCHWVRRCSQTLTWCPGRASAPCIWAARGRSPWKDRLWSLQCGGPFVRWAGRRAAWRLLDNCENSHRQGGEDREMFRVTGILNESLKIKPLSCQLVFKESKSLFKVWNSFSVWSDWSGLKGKPPTLCSGGWLTGWHPGGQPWLPPQWPECSWGGCGRTAQPPSVYSSPGSRWSEREETQRPVNRNTQTESVQ